MATKTKSVGWTNDKAIKAAARHRFIHAGATSSGDWVLSGAPDHWAKGEDYVYIPAIRVAGTRQEVINFMTQFVPAATANAWIEQNGYTLNNYQAKLSEINNAINAQKAYDEAKKNAKAAVPGYTLGQVRLILGNYTDAVPAVKREKGKGKKGGGVESLYNKVQKVIAENAGKTAASGQWKVINVTKMDKTGKEARRMAYNPNGKMTMIGSLPIVVNRSGDANKARDAYYQAIDLLNSQAPAGTNFDSYKQQYLQASVGSSITNLISGQTQQAQAQPQFQPQFQTGLVRTQLTPSQPIATGLPQLPTLPAANGLPTGLPQLPTLQ